MRWLLLWWGRQFLEPTGLYHATGWVMLVVEVVQSWFHGHVVDPSVVYVASIFIGGGIAQDRINTPPAPK